jgi:putative transposase
VRINGLKDLGRGDDCKIGRWLSNRAENSHLPFRGREREMLRFRRMRTLRKFASVHATVLNHFAAERHLQDRNAQKQTRADTLAEWRGIPAP